ncbi:hypothetical protein [Nonomuraea sp. NPDC050202]|uniref:hypothetical protein n=1 Tax=Nonomuraea sp. NPDC050202 TaxID=3155035 RepID=UPI0033D291C4
MTEHQYLNIFGQIGVGRHRQQVEQALHRLVDRRQQHLAMVAAAALIMQQSPVQSTEPYFERDTPPRTFSKTAAVVVITAKSAGRKVFGLATAGVRLA